MDNTIGLLEAKIKELAIRESYGGSKKKPSIKAEVIDYDIDVERGFTVVILDAKVRDLKSGRMGKKSSMVYGYAKRNNGEGDLQDESIGLGHALSDAIRRALGISRRNRS